MTAFKGQNAWEQVELNDIADKSTLKNRKNENKIVLTNSAELGIVKQQDYFDKDIANSKNLSNYYVVKNNYFVYNPRISNQAKYGPINYNSLGIVGIMSPLYFVFKVHNNVNNIFLGVLFKTSVWHRFMYENGDTGARADRFSIKDSVFMTMPLNIPSITEQSKIAKLFQSLDKTITLHEEKQRQLERLKKALLQKMFADETGYPVLRFKAFTEKWEQRKFSELYSKNVERNSTNEFNFDKTISIAKMRYNSEGNGASKKSLQNYKVIRIGDVAFEGHTNKEFQYGRFVVNSLGNGIMSPRFAVLRPIRPTVVNFWKYYLHNERSMNRILVRATKAGTMMNELVYSDLAKEKIKVPIEKEQLEIGNLFSIVDKTITLHDKKIQYLKQLKRGLLQKMFV